LILHDEKISILPGSPFIFSVLADLPEDELESSAIRICLSSGAPLPLSIEAKFFNRYSCHIGQIYGSTESACVSICRGDSDSAASNSVGTPVAGVELRIIDPAEGCPLPPGTPGELIVRSPAMMVGYANRPDLTEAVIRDGFYHTGDLGFIDELGRLHLSGRRSTLINVSGIKIDPVEIEQVILACPGVSRVSISGERDHRDLVVLKAVVAGSAPILRGDILATCREHLAEFKIPKIIEIVSDDSMGISQKAVFHC
jgi:long-chain acyl-CoA synthetase